MSAVPLAGDPAVRCAAVCVSSDDAASAPLPRTTDQSPDGYAELDSATAICTPAASKRSREMGSETPVIDTPPEMADAGTVKRYAAMPAYAISVIAAVS